MKYKCSTILLIVMILGCKKPFSQIPETALALPIEVLKTNRSVVFIAGFDEGQNKYYGQAKKYFEGKDMLLIENLFSIDDIINWLNQNSKIQAGFNEIHIVSHSNAWSGMALKTSTNGARITLKSLRNARKNYEIRAIQSGITNETKVIFHSCGLGQNQVLLQELKQTFTNGEAPILFASSFFNVFGGKYAAHYLAKPYYNFYPTSESPGPAALSKEFRTKYPKANIDWFTAIKTRQETTLGKVYSYTFNVPVNWEFTFDDTTPAPQLKDRESIMDWISETTEMAEALYHLNIPLEKYRWRSEIRGDKLILKGKASVLCVLQPILDPNDRNEYRGTVVEDSFLYQIL